MRPISNLFLLCCLLSTLSCSKPKEVIAPKRGPLPPREDLLAERPPESIPDEEPEELPEQPTPPPSASFPLLFSELTSFDASLGESLSEISLQGTEDCPSEPLRQRLETHFRRHFDAPLLARSGDPKLRALAAELMAIGPHAAPGHAHHNIAMGPVDVTACAPCDYEAPGTCDQEKCDRLRAFAIPADISSAGLDEHLVFGGASEATDQGVEISSGVSLKEYLNSVEEAGLSHEIIKRECLTISKLLVRRCLFIEEPLRAKPADLPSVTAFSEALIAALSAIRAVYSPEAPKLIRPERFSFPTDENAFLFRKEAFIQLEQRLTSRFSWSAARKWRSGILALRKENLALDRGEPSPGGLELVPAALDPDEYPHPCLSATSKSGEDTFDSACQETMDALSVLEWGLVSQEPRDENETELVAVKIALGLERLLDAKVTLATIEQEMTRFISDSKAASRRPPAPRSN